jgi:hypothetical protein
MATKIVGGAFVAVLLASVTWWWLDPVGFLQNPVVVWVKQFSFGLPLPGR